MGEDRGEWVNHGILKRRELLGLLLHLHPRVDEVKSQHTTMALTRPETGHQVALKECAEKVR